MKNKVVKFKLRRMKRILSRLDAEDDEEGKWITTENNHKVHLNEEGEPDKGNPYVIDKMASGSFKLRHPEEAFIQDRKNGAVWDKSGGSEYDKIMRGITSKIWKTKGINHDALWRYTTDKDYGYGDMNYQLRNGAMDWWTDYDKGKVTKNVDALTKAIDMSEAPKDVWLQRGCTMNSLCKLFGVPENERSGMEGKEPDDILKAITSYVDYGQDKAFMSCGSGKGKGTNAPVILNVYCPKGTKMLYAEPFSAWGNGGNADWDGKSGQVKFSAEDETILQRGTMLVPQKVSKKDGVVYVDVDVIGQEY